MKTYQLTQHFDLNEFTRSAIAIANGIDKIRWIFSRRTKCLFHVEFAEFAEKEIPIILRILREIKNILREKGRKEMVTMPILQRASGVSSSCLCRYFAMPPLLNGDRTDIERRHKKGISEDFSTGDASLHLFHAEYAEKNIPIISAYSA